MLNNVYSQQNTNSAGGRHNGIGGTSSFSIGQTFFSQNINASFKINQGIQQPFEISFIIVGVEEIIDISTELTVFPNPIDDIINLKLEKIKSANLFFQLNDLQGKILKKEKLSIEDPIIRLNGLPTATYFLTILNKNGILKTFKIIKK